MFVLFSCEYVKLEFVTSETVLSGVMSLTVSVSVFIETAISASCSFALFRIIGEKITSSSEIETVAEISMTIKNIGSDTWEMAFEGPYTLLGDTYPVNFIMKAKRGSLISGNHYNWGVTLSGNRTEREGYSCTYATNNTVLYMCTQGNTVGWNYLEGAYSLTVILNRQPIDLWAMIFKGNLSNTEFTRGI